MKPFTVIWPFLIALHFPRWPIFHNICSLLSELEALLFLPLPPPSLLLLLSLIALIHPPLLMPVIFLSSFHAPTSSYNRFKSSSSSSSFSLTLLSHPVLSLSASTLLHFLSSPLSLTHSCRRKPLILYTHFLPVLRLPHCCSSIIPPPSNLVLLSSSSSFISLHHIPAFHILPLSSPPLPLLPSSLLCF